jgi:hypothetical protein
MQRRLPHTVARRGVGFEVETIDGRRETLAHVFRHHSRMRSNAGPTSDGSA